MYVIAFSAYFSKNSYSEFSEGYFFSNQNWMENIINMESSMSYSFFQEDADQLELSLLSNHSKYHF